MGARLAVATATLAALMACKGDEGPGPAPPPAAPQITCGATISVDNVSGSSQTVSYPLPQTSAGAQPVIVTCTPASESTFAIGDTVVTCTAGDALGRQASCSFIVSVRHKALAIARILAFGDSLTAGENGLLVNFVPVVDAANAYPTYLQQFFVERIPTQQVTVVNEGRGGERVTENEDRLKARLDAVRPQALLLLEGMNDIIGNLSASEIAAAIDDSIRRARDRDVQYIFIGTLPPQARENCRPAPNLPCRADLVPPALLEETNQRIRTLVASRNAYVVDVHDRFVANRLQYVGADGLHLTPEGNRALATLFWDRIAEVVPASQLR